MAKTLVGKVEHYFGKVGVAIVDLSDTVKVGDKIAIEGPSTMFEQVIDSIQVEHKPVQSAKKGDAIGIKVKDKVREKDNVFRVV
ncbi:MAG TPA: translation elongation factor-like protein [archaeon]|nr:translation elongation factor-like protein [archaeon]